MKKAYTEINFMRTTSLFSTILHVLKAADVNFMLVHCIAALYTTSFGHTKTEKAGEKVATLSLAKDGAGS